MSELLQTLAIQWKAVWTAFADAGPLANAFQIVGFVVTLVTGARWYIHRRLKDKEGRILDLQDDLAARDKKLDEVRSALKDAKNRVFTDLSTAPEAAENE